MTLSVLFVGRGMPDPNEEGPMSMDPMLWMETPPLAAVLPAYRADDNIWWRMGCGHHQNLFEEACDRIAKLEAELEAANAALLHAATTWNSRDGNAAGVAASPSEEEVLNAAWQIGQNHYWTLGGHHDGKWLDLRGYAALAALRTTKEGEHGT